MLYQDRGGDNRRYRGPKLKIIHVEAEGTDGFVGAAEDEESFEAANTAPLA